MGRIVAVPAGVLLMVLAGCTANPPVARWADDGSGPAASISASPTVELTISPAKGSTQLPVAVEIGTVVKYGTITSVTLVGADNRPVSGTMRADGSSWVPDRPLKYRSTYTATVTAAAADGTTVTRTTTFSTMAKPAGSRVGSGLYLFDGVKYGVAMPIVVEFDEPIPKSARAQVERRLFVTSTPPQPGAWGWITDRQVMYRGPRYWQPGTKLTVRTALEGLPIGTRYGDADRRATGVISDELIIDVDNGTKQMTVTRNGQVLRTLPVSLGRPGMPSSSGTMVIMEKKAKTIFDTRNDPNPANRYVTPVEYAQRLTWGGEYIHAAPWSVAQQGRTNVSHGCVNISTDNAAWLYSITHIGDPVTIRGTERRLAPGNGWTAWDLTWPEFLRLSALPHPEFNQ